MFITKKERTVTNVLKLLVPVITEVQSYSEIEPSEPIIEEKLIGQVFCTIQDDSSCTVTKDIWNKQLFNMWKEKIEETIYKFELECKQDILDQGVEIESNRDLVFSNKIDELEKDYSDVNEELLLQSESQLDLDFRLTSLELGL